MGTHTNMHAYRRLHRNNFKKPGVPAAGHCASGLKYVLLLCIYSYVSRFAKRSPQISTISTYIATYTYVTQLVFTLLFKKLLAELSIITLIMMKISGLRTTYSTIRLYFFKYTKLDMCKTLYAESTNIL